MTMRVASLTLDDRRELWRMLDRLLPGQRIAFLRWCCQQTSGPGNIQAGVTDHTGLTGEAYRDLMALEVIYGLDLEAAGCRLARFLKRTGR